MKLSKTALVGGMIAVLGISTPLRAEKPEAGKQCPMMHGWGDKNWTQGLDLSADQEQQFKAALDAKREATRELQKKMHEDLKKLQAQVTLKVKDPEIKKTLDELNKTHKAMSAEHEKFTNALNAFLTPIQRAKLAVSMMRHAGGWGGHHCALCVKHGGKEAPKSDMKDAPNDDSEGSTEESQ